MTGRSDSVAFLVDESQERMFSDPFFLGMLRSAQVAVAEAGLQLVFTMTSRREDHERFLSYAAGGHVDGVLLMSLHGQDSSVAAGEAGHPDRAERTSAESQPAPVLRGRRQRRRRPDRHRHLLGSGRRVVATVTGPQDMCAGQDRLAGYQLALADAGVRYDGSRVWRIRAMIQQVHAHQNGQRFDVSRETVYSIKHRRTWRWLQGSA